MICTAPGASCTTTGLVFHRGSGHAGSGGRAEEKSEPRGAVPPAPQQAAPPEGAQPEPPYGEEQQFKENDIPF